MRGSKRRAQEIRTHLKNYKNKGFLSNTSPDPLKTHKPTKPAFLLGYDLHASETPFKMACRWRADDGPLIVVFGSFIPPQTKKTLSKLNPI